MGSLTIEEYLQVLPNYVFPDRIIQKAMGAYDIEPGSLAFSIDERKRDLAESIMWEAASGLVNGGGEKRQIGDRSISSNSLQTSKHDRQVWAEKASALRAKWGETALAADVLNIHDLTVLW